MRCATRPRRCICSASTSGLPRSHPSDSTTTIAPRAKPRTPQRSLNARIHSPMRVPPLQSATCCDARLSALSGSRCESSRVTRVRRVPSVNASTRWRPTIAACMNRKNARAYGSIEPETSSNTTSRRKRSLGSRQWRRTGSPKWANDVRTVRRTSTLPCRARDGRWRNERRGDPTNRRRRIRRCASANSLSV